MTNKPLLLLLSAVILIFAPSFSLMAQWNTTGANISNANGGNVGIGLNAPGAKLHVLGVGDVNKDFLVNGRIQSGDANNNGGMWCGIDDKTFVGRTLANIGFYNNGAWRLLVDPNGNVGIGTGTPLDKLSISQGHIRLDIGKTIGINSADAFNSRPYYSLGWFNDPQNSSGAMAYLSGYSGIKLFTVNQQRFYLDISGNVGIGTSSDLVEKLEVAGYVKATGFKDASGSLLVSSQWATSGSLITTNYDVTINGNTRINGKLLSKGFKITTSPSSDPFPDFVFNAEYKLRPLAELGAYIDLHKHLPGVISAAQVKEEGGFEMGKLNLQMLEKLEETTLYVLQLNKKIDAMQKEIATLKKTK